MREECSVETNNSNRFLLLCKKCQERKPPEDFYPSMRGDRNRGKPKCKDCHNREVNDLDQRREQRGQPERKVCIACNQERDITEFHRDGHGGRRARCRLCVTTHVGRGRRAILLKNTYAMTHDDYDRMFEAQGGQCAICKSPPDEGKHFHIDHSHEEDGQVRGLLCFRCNAGIGMLGDDPERLMIARDYLMAHRVRVKEQ